MKKNMHAKTLAIVLATTTALQMTGITSQILNGVPFVTAYADVAPTKVTITGTERVGKTLEAKLYSGSTVYTTSAGVTYEWRRLSSKSSTGTLEGSGSTYELDSSDKGDYIKLIVRYNGTVIDDDITGTISRKSSSSSDNGDYELDSLELLNSNNETIKFYDNDNYEDRVDEEDVDAGDTYYVKTASNSIHIDTDGVDTDNIKVFKGTSDSTKGKNANEDISISGDTTIVVRTYDEDVSDETVKYDDNDYDYDSEYTIKVKYTGSGNTAATNNTIVNNTVIQSIGFQTTSTGVRKIVENGKFVTGWKLINGTWYLADSTGTVLTGWQLVNGNWYLLNYSGAMVTGWQQTNAKWYYLYSNGAMASNTVINGYKVDTTGAWIN